jgi:DnaJ-domain-containing protein 1
VDCSCWPPVAVAVSSDRPQSVGPTATWYEILGVAPDAGHEDLKRAYTAAAVEWHPDHWREASPDEQERAERHIREVNAAWEVLGTPAARAAYDAELAESRRPRPVPTPGATTRARTPSFGDRLVDPRTSRGAVVGGERRGWRWVPVIVIGLVVVGVLVATAYAAHHHDGGPSGGVQVHPDQYPVGSCVAVAPGPVAYTVPCDQPHTGTVAATTDYPRPCPSGTSTVALVEQQLSLCLTP